MDANEVRDQLLNCLDTSIQLFVHRDLGSNVDTAVEGSVHDYLEGCV